MAPSLLTSLPELDEDGLLLKPESWNKEVSETLAEMFGIDPLTEEHWQVIHALRNYYRQHGVPPAMITVCHKLGMDKQRVHNLFQTCLNAWRIAGLPNPGEEAKSYLSDM